MAEKLTSNLNGIKVKDINGNPVEGAYKNPSGSVIYNNEKNLAAYLKRKDIARKQNNQIKSLLDEIEELKKLIKDKNG